MNTPLVSVIIPTKNSTQTLDACLKSIKQQTYKNIEIIVTDNHSSDATDIIAKSHGVKFLVEGDERSTQRNAGARNSAGEFLLFIDSDMELEPNVVEECMQNIQQNHTLQAIVIPEQSFGEGFWATCKAFERSFYLETPWMQAVRFFRKDAYELTGGFDETMSGAEDFDIHNRIRNIFHTEDITTINANILHNEGNVALWKLLKKKRYYGSSITHYKNNAHNVLAYKKQASLISRFILFFSQPKKILSHPILFVGIMFMKTAEFTAGGLGYITNLYQKNTPITQTVEVTYSNSTNLPSVSFVTCTLNSARLIEECLQSIKSLDYPKHLLEIIVVDGGSTDATLQVARRLQCTIIEERTGRPEAATAIGYNQAKHDIIVNFPSDNVITDKKWLRLMVQPFIEHTNVVGTYTLKYEYNRNDNALNRCFALFGAGDPVAYYMNKRDRMTYLKNDYPKSSNTKDCGNYYLVTFQKNNIPTLGANGFLIRRSFGQSVSNEPMSFFHIDTIYDLIAQGHNTFAIVKNQIWHRTGESFTNFFTRRVRYINIYFNDKHLRRYHVVDMQTDKWKLTKYILYSLTFIEPTIQAMRGYIQIRDWAWFLHPIISFLCVPIYSYALAKIFFKGVTSQQS